MPTDENSFKLFGIIISSIFLSKVLANNKKINEKIKCSFIVYVDAYNAIKNANSEIILLIFFLYMLSI